MGDPLLLVDYAFKAVAKVVELLQQATEVDGHCRELLPVVKSMGPLLKQIERELRGSASPVPDAVPEALKRMRGVLERALADLAPIAKLAAKSTYVSTITRVTRAKEHAGVVRETRARLGEALQHLTVALDLAQLRDSRLLAEKLHGDLAHIRDDMKNVLISMAEVKIMLERLILCGAPSASDLQELEEERDRLHEALHFKEEKMMEQILGLLAREPAGASFTCPIIMEIMTDPVMLCASGQTYERWAILKWLQEHDTCPVSGMPLHRDHRLVPNHAIRRVLPYVVPLPRNSPRAHECPPDAAASASSSAAAQAASWTGPGAPAAELPAPAVAAPTIAPRVIGVGAPAVERSAASEVAEPTPPTPTLSAIETLGGLPKRLGPSSLASTWAKPAAAPAAAECTPPTSSSTADVSRPSEHVPAVHGQRNVLEGHTNAVIHVAKSPDGSKLAKASGDKTAAIWDPATGRRLRSLEGHARGVTCVAWSPDGTKVATASYDETAALWDPATGRRLRSLEGHARGVTCVAWSPDGSMVATASKYKQAIGDIRHQDDWQHSALERQHVSSHHRSHETDRPQSSDRQQDVVLCVVLCVAWSPDGAQLATASYDHTAALWDTATGRRLHSLEGHTHYVNCVAWSPDGTQVATASTDYTAALWDPATGRRLRSLEGHTFSVMCVAWSPDGSKVATASWDNTAAIWDPATGRRLRSMGHTNWVTCVAWSPDGTKVATASYDGTVALWDPVTGRRLRSLEGHTKWVQCVSWSPDGSKVATASRDKTAALWDPVTGRRLRSLEGHTAVCWVAWSPDGTKVATALADKTAALWAVS